MGDWINVKQKSIEEIRRLQSNAIDTFGITDIGGVAQRVNGHRWEKGKKYLMEGNPEITEESKKFIEKFENEIFVGRGWKNADRVVGAVPNIPAFLAGQPMCMRQRVRTSSHMGHLTILLETTGSAGIFDSRIERGAAMMALARMLANTRPVDLWILTTFGGRGYMNMLAVKMDTNPLDIARSAAMLADPQASQALFEVCRDYVGGGSWSYGTESLERRWAGEAFKRLVNPSSEILYVPAAYYNDHNARNPAKWVKDMLVKYGMEAAHGGNDA